MKYSSIRLCPIIGAGIVVSVVLFAMRHATAQVVAPSIYTTSIHVQGEPVGTEFDDWAASGIPVVTMDPEDNPGDLDIANVQIANDNDYIYIHATTYSPSSISLVNLFLAFDNDRDKSTGFDILQIGEIGSEVGYQNDYPFAQYSGVFNLNISLTGGPVNNGGALIFPFWADASGPQGTEIEWAVPRAVLIQYPPALGGPSPTFPNPSFDFVIYTPNGLADITDVITYTFAAAPSNSGDYNGDGVVNAADYTVWRDTLGSTEDLRANGDDTGASMGVIDQADYSFWKSHFGGAGAGAISAAVPEPTAAGLLGVALLAIGLRRRGR
jgi:hypothetical protein